MKRAIYRTIPFALTACALWAQQAEFEVATIKPTPPPEQSGGRIMIRMGCNNDPIRVDCSGLTVKDMLIRAYNMKPYQINATGWVDSDRWDVKAKVPDGTPTDKVAEMWQSLLSSRFHLTSHKEVKELNIYALVVGKNGPKLTPAEDAKPITVTSPDGAQIKVGGPAAGGGGGGPRPGAMIMDGSGKMQMKGMTLQGFSDSLSRMMDRPVIDMTKIDGRYDIVLEVSMEDMIGMKKMAGGVAMMHGGGEGPAPDANPRGSVFTAVGQLGLKLEPRKSPIESLFVDKAEKPTEN